jgi:hypothetical protein
MRVNRARMASVAAVVAVSAVGLLVIAVGTAPAGNRDPMPTLVGLPGPGEVTYGQNVAYTATLPNSQSSTFTKTQFHNPIPTTSGGPAALAYASCPGTLTATEFVCNEITVPSGQTAKVTIVWTTPASGSSIDCPSSVPVCMTNKTFWTIKEGTGNAGSSGPDTFQSPLVATSLLVVPDFVEAGGYALNACTNPATQESLETNPGVGPTNKVATKVCASTVPGQLHDPGVVIEIDEGIGPFNAGVTESSSICIPAPGASCGDANPVPWTFTPPATFTFTIDNTTLPSGEKIDKVFHDGVLDANDPDFSCSITIVNKTKTTIVTCQSADNGWWDFG